MKQIYVLILFSLFFSILFVEKSYSEESLGEKFHGEKLTSAAAKPKLDKILEGFDEPVAIAFLPRRSKKIGVLERSGKLLIVHRDSPEKKNLLFDLGTSPGVRHPLDFVFHPEFSKNGRIFISFFLETSYGADLVISEFLKAAEDDKILAQSEQEVLRLRQFNKSERITPLLFDKTGALLIGLSDGGKKFDPASNASNLKNLYGTVIRLNVEETSNYIPSLDNPFVMSDRGRREIYSFGLRDPSSLVLDSETGEIYVGERGESSYEEINLLKPSANFGWPVVEGDTCLKMRFECSNQRSVPALFKYSHNIGTKVSLIAVLRPKKASSLSGVLLFSDINKKQIWALKKSNGAKPKVKKLLDTELEMIDFTQDSQGQTYVLDKKQGAIFQLQIEGDLL